MAQMSLSEELQWRGFVSQTTLADLKELDTHERTFYMGFDASADSQAVGNLAAMMFAKTFLRHGWPGILLAGGSTSLIGDPGGKDRERPLQDEKTVAHNILKAEAQIRQILGSHGYKLVNNLDWTKDLRVIPFLRDIGKHFSMTPLIQRDYIATRLGEKGSGISYAEFSYTILQGYDYLHLYDTEKVTLQLGGSDQWGNCLSGVELIRKARGAEVDVITLNLMINKATGKKFGKSEEGAVWLDAAKTSVYRFYQFWLNADDEGVESYLKIFTEQDKAAIEQIMKEFRTDKAGRRAQKVLAYEVTKLVHGTEAADAAKNATDVLFGAKDYATLTEKEFKLLQNELPVTDVKSGNEIVPVVTAAGLVQSNSEARRVVQQGGVYINGIKVSIDKKLTDDDFIAGYSILRVGKNKSALLKRKP